MKLKLKLTAILIACLMAAPVTWAKEIGGINLPDTLKAGNAGLMLNGAGLRKKLWVEVYAGGLYLSAKSSDAAKILAADAAMAIRMHIIYKKVDKKKLIKAWNEGFENGTGGNTAPIKAEIDKFNGFFSTDAKKGDIYDVVYEPGKGVSVIINNQANGPIPGLDFKKAVFGIWLGEKAANKKLKKGMLAQ